MAMERGLMWVGEGRDLLVEACGGSSNSSRIRRRKGGGSGGMEEGVYVYNMCCWCVLYEYM